MTELRPSAPTTRSLCSVLLTGLAPYRDPPHAPVGTDETAHGDAQLHPEVGERSHGIDHRLEKRRLGKGRLAGEGQQTRDASRCETPGGRWRTARSPSGQRAGSSSRRRPVPSAAAPRDRWAAAPRRGTPGRNLAAARAASRRRLATPADRPGSPLPGRLLRTMTDVEESGIHSVVWLKETSACGHRPQTQREIG